MIEHQSDGSTLLTDDFNESRVQLLSASLSEAEQDVAIAVFFGPNLSMPDSVPMSNLRLLLIATGRMDQVTTFLNSLPAVQKAMAVSEFDYAVNFIPGDALGLAAKAALGLSDADYALAVRTAEVTTFDDYANPSEALALILAGLTAAT